MSTWNPRANELFLKARELRSADERQVYLGQECSGDVALQAEVESLLEASAQAGSFLESPAPAPQLDATVDASSVTEQPGAVVGSYKLLEQIGEGGFGLVFMAEQTAPVRRRLALKVLKPGMDTRQVVARFEAERQALAIMDHPNIARVFDGGATVSGRPYFVMELVRGIPITEFCDHNHLSVRQRLELFVPVCQAVQHAHQKGVIHRDIKPTNVLVTLHDGMPVPKVIDFGIAKATGQPLTERTLFTNFAQMIGTPLYMSPEQAEMSGLDVDTRADVYALGVLLYELLTGTTPFDRERFRTAGYDEIRRIIREEEPARPSTRISTLGQAGARVSASRKSDPRGLCRLFRGDLDWVVMKCLEKDRNRRYEAASALAADVQRHLRDEPVQACPPSVWYRVRKLARRNRRTLVTISVLALAALVGVGALAVSTVLVWKANTDLKEAIDRERREAYFQRITVAHRELSTDNLAAALRALQDCPENLRGWEWHYLMRLCKVEPLVLRDRTEVNGVAFSPDGERLVSAGGDGAIKVWNSRTGGVVQTFPAHSDSVVSVAFHPDGNHVASVGADKQVKVWDLKTDLPVFTSPCDAIRKFGSACTVAFSPDGRQLTAGSDGTVKIWDWKNRQVLHTFPGHEKNAISVAFSRGGRRLASASTGEGVKLWDAQIGGLPLHTFVAHRHPVSALAFSPDGERLASASLGRRVDLWDTATGKLLHTFPHTGTVESVSFSPDGQRLASTGEDKTVRIWEATTGRKVLGLRGHTDRCGCVTFSPDGRRLASASEDRTIRVWDATPLDGHEGQELFTFAGHDDEIRSVVVSPDGRRIASAGRGNPVKVWDAVTREVSTEFDGHTTVVFCLTWQPDGQRIASAGWDGRVHRVWVWDARTGKPIFQLPPGPACFAVAFSPDGRYLVTGKGNGAVQVWDARTGQPIGPLGTHEREIRGLAFSRKGGHLASASNDGEVKLWDATRLNQKQEARLTLHARVHGPSLNLAFSPDGLRLATAGQENTVKIWDVETGREMHSLPGHRGDVYAVAFSPNEGRWIASGGEDSTVKIWDSRSGELVHSFRGHTALVCSLAFGLDGRRLYSGSRDTTVKVWDLTPLRQVPDR
jgi:eukaryotic-like serine/threonine-protein kinase